MTISKLRKYISSNSSDVNDVLEFINTPEKSIDKFRSVVYHLHGNFREDDPARERSDGTKYWYLNGIFQNSNYLDIF